MNISITAAAGAAALSLLLSSTAVTAQANAASPADAALAAGNFDSAATAYAAALARNPNDAAAELGLGTIELYRNDLSAARGHLQRAVTLEPASAIARTRLASIEKRLGGPNDYRIAFARNEVRVPLVSVDPLPALKATIDGIPVTLAIDTGGPSIDLSAAVVKRLGLRAGAAGEGIFAGGLKAKVQSIRIDRFEVDGLTVSGIPGGVIPGGLNALNGRMGVDGIIGTGFLYHFLSTIDYAHRALVLRPAAESGEFLASARAAGAATTPMWLVGDHLIFARARVNDAPEGLYGIDTGGPGIGVDLSKSALAAAGITPDASRAQSIMGGGGATQILPFIAARVTMAGITEHDLPESTFRAAVWTASSRLPSPAGFRTSSLSA